MLHLILIRCIKSIPCVCAMLLSVHTETDKNSTCPSENNGVLIRFCMQSYFKGHAFVILLVCFFLVCWCLSYMCNYPFLVFSFLVLGVVFFNHWILVCCLCRPTCRWVQHTSLPQGGECSPQMQCCARKRNTVIFVYAFTMYIIYQNTLFYCLF